MHSPVLFLIFNRPDTTARVFEAIRQAKPPRLYIAGDGPRANRDGEAERVAKVRQIVTQVDWPCEMKTLFRDQNLGCKMAVSGAINWFFEHEEQGIILEDDVLPDASFFPFCDELLARYKDDERVMAISGANPVSGYSRPSADYFFSLFVHVWGWATWRRAWAKYNVTMADWSLWRKNLSMMGHGFLFRMYWNRQFERTFSGHIDTWDFQWVYSIWKNNGFCATATKNLTQNIGFGDGATHTHDVPDYVKRSVVDPMKFPLQHPTIIARDLAMEKLDLEIAFDLTYRAQIFKRLKKMMW